MIKQAPLTFAVICILGLIAAYFLVDYLRREALSRKDDLIADLRKKIDLQPTQAVAENDCLKTECPDKWLHGAADFQKETLEHSFVKVEKVGIGQHDLLRESPYIDFGFLVTNYSIYNLSLGELSGSITYAGRLLSKPPFWPDNSVKNLRINGTGCVIRQPLSKEDVEHILNMGGAFEFNNLKIRINSTPNFTDSAPKYLFFTDPIHHYEIHKAYPQLEIEIKQAQLKTYFDPSPTKNPFDAQLVGSVINIQVHFENPRERAVDIQSIKLNTDPNVTRITPAERGEIFYCHDYFGKEITGKRLNNLNECPIHAERRHPFDGWLQFILQGVLPEKLRGATPTVVMVDSSGQEHRRGCPSLQQD